MRLFFSSLIGWLSLAVIMPARTITVDLLQSGGWTQNAAGPLLVASDGPRDRIIVVHTLTSTVSVISGKPRRALNIPLNGRVPHYVKSEALTVDSRSGRIYVIGTECLHVVDPETRTARSFPTEKQYEMVAVDERNGNAFLVGRGSRSMAFVQPAKNRVTQIPWAESEEQMVNLNQTPPPPLRKVMVDEEGRRVYALDGASARLYTFRADDGKPLSKRKLPLEPVARWHLAGCDKTNKTMLVVLETAKRQVVSAARIDLRGTADKVMQLPGLTEGCGIVFHPDRGEIYIPYDNGPLVHVVNFQETAPVEIRIPTFGNDAAAVDVRRDRLYVSSWAYGEIEEIDLRQRKWLRRFENLGILPHMFSLVFHAPDDTLYFPLGATAVNGSFGAAVTAFSPQSGTREKIRTGWAPVTMIANPWRDGVLVCNNEDQMAEVDPDGTAKFHPLPCLFPHQAIAGPGRTVYIAYGPHQSYWPVVYIWGARNGILSLDEEGHWHDRRTPRLAQSIVCDEKGVLYGLQNNWGDEKQFLITLPDEVRHPNLGDMRMELEDTVTREATQRLVRYDPGRHWLYILRLGETDEASGVLQIVDTATKRTIKRLEVGRTPTDLVFDDAFIYVCAMDDDRVRKIAKEGFSEEILPVGRQPLRLAAAADGVYVLHHGGNTVQRVSPPAEPVPLPVPGRPDGLFAAGGRLYAISHAPQEMNLLRLETEGRWSVLHRFAYPYGDTAFDGANCAFYQRGQYGDAVFALNEFLVDSRGRCWLSDFLSGKLFILNWD